MNKHLHTVGILGLFLLFAPFSKTVFAQNSLNSGDFSTGTWGVGQAMAGSAGGSLIITRGVTTAGDKFFRFYGDGSPCGEYQPNANGDFFTHNVVVTAPNGNCGGTNAWRINVPTVASNVVFKTDGGNDGIDRSIAFVVQGAIQSVSSVTRLPAVNVFPGQDVTVTANLTADFSTGQDAWLRYTNDAFATSTVVKMTGSGTTRTATIPGATNTPSTAVAYYVFTSGDGASISPADADFYTINLNNNGGSNYTYTTQAGWTTNATGSWNVAGTWTANAVPPTATNMGTVTIGHAVTLNQNARVGSIVLNTATANILTLGAGQTLEIAAGGSITRSSTTATLSASATSIVRFLGAGSIGWANGWGNLETGGLLTTTGVQTINTSFQINSGGSISIGPTYAVGSTLIYNSGGTYNQGTEWNSNDAVTATALASRPMNVTIQGSTTLNARNTAQAMFGNLTIGTGSTLVLNTTLGADLSLNGNWTNSGNFTPNSRAVFFRGATTSTVSRAGGETFDFLAVAKTAGVNLQLLSNVTVAGNTGDVLQLINTVTGGGIDLNGNTLSLTGTGGNISLGAGALARNITGTSGSLVISGGTKTVTRSATSTLTIAAGVNVQLSSGLNFGTAAVVPPPVSFTTLLGTLTINFGGFVSTMPPIFGTASTLVYNSGGTYGGGSEWTQTADATPPLTGYPVNVTIQNNTTLNMPTNFRAMAGNLNITSGSTLNLNSSAGDLSLRGNWLCAGSFNPNTRNVIFRGATAVTTVNSGGSSFYTITIDKGAGAFNIQLLSNMTITHNSGSVLTMAGTITNGSGIDLNGFNLNLTGTAGNIDLGAGTALVRNITGIGNVNLTGGAKSIVRTTSNTLTIGAATSLNTSIALTLSAASILTVNGTLQLNAGGSIVTNTPIYGASSTLIYSVGGTPTVSTEWTSAALTAPPVAGRPRNVTISNSTNLNMTTTDRSLYGNLLVETGSALTLNGTSGNFLCGGNWTRQTGTTFTQNGRTVQFWAVAPLLATSIDVSGGETFGALTIAKTAGIYVNLACNVIVNGALTVTTGRLNIGANTLTLNGNVSTIATNGTISGNGNSNLVVNGSGAGANLIFTTAVAENRLGSLTINRSGPGTVLLQSNLLIDNGSGLNNSNLTLTSGWLEFTTGITLTVANTSITGNANSFVTTLLTGRFAYAVTGAGTNTLTYPIGNASNVNSYRPVVINNVSQTATNTYSIAATTGAAISSGIATYAAPLIGVSVTRYYPFSITTLANVSAIGTISLIMGPDENPGGLDNQLIAQTFGGTWNSLGSSGVSPKTSTSIVNIGAASSFFALGFSSLNTVFVNTTGNDANSGQNATNVPVGTGPKQTLNAATNAVINGGTISYTGTYPAQTWNLNKNLNLTATVTTSLTNVVLNLTSKGVMPFTETDVNTTTDRITVTAHQLTTGMPVTFANYGHANGLMPSGINVGADEITIGANVPTGQPVIYQAYPAAGEAGGLTHGTTYFAINVNPTTIQLAASYADALSATAIDITTVGSALSHGIIESVPQGLTSGTGYFAIVVDANTVQLATSNANALAGTAIDLLTNGGGNHVLTFTPTISGTLTGSPTLNVNDVQAYINPHIALTSTNPTINLMAGTFSMQPTVTIAKTMTFNGNGIGNTIFDGEGKISSATSYFGINLAGIAAGTVTISNLRITGYYAGINRNSATANATTNIDNVDASDNFSSGINFEGTGAITTGLNIRNGIASNNNGVGVNSYGIHISGMSKTGVNIRNMVLNGNRNSGIEIGTGTLVSVVIRGNTISGTNAASPLSNSVTEFGIRFNGAAAVPTGSNTAISNNSIVMIGRGGIECRGCVGNATTAGVNSFRIASNYITQAGGPFTIDPATSSPANEIRDIAAIAVGNINGSGNSASMVIDTNQIEAINQPNAITTDYTAFGIVTAGNSHVLRANIVTGCEIGIQAQQGATGTDAIGDNFYSRDATVTSTGYTANRNSITGNTVFGARNEGLAGTINFLGNWWGHVNGPTHASNTDAGVAGFGAGGGELIPPGTGIAYNANLDADPDDNVGTGSGQRGIQVTSAKSFRLKPAANTVILATPNILNQGVSVGFSTATAGFTDVLRICPVTYTLSGETVVVNRRMNLCGNFGTGTKPVINGTGDQINTDSDVSGQRMLIAVNSQQVIIENLRIQVNGSILSDTRSGISTNNNTPAASIIEGLIIRNNEIINTNTSTLFHASSSFGIYLKERSFGVNDPSVVTIENNEISNASNTFGFGVGIRTWGLRLSASNNTIRGGFSLRHGTPVQTGGTVNFTGNTLYGMVEYNSPNANSTTNFTNNDFFRNPDLTHLANFEIRLNRFPTAFINLNGNTFDDIAEGGYPYWGVLSLRSQNISLTNNVFIAHPLATDFQFILASTRQQGTLANPSDNFANTISIKGNEFIGNSAVASNKIGIHIARHRQEQTFGTIEVGGPGADANTFLGLNRYIELGPNSGLFSSLGLPYIALTGTPDATVTPMDVDFDASQNIYRVSGGDKLPSAMTKAELVELEDKIQHAIDFADLGFVTLKANTAIVTENSFLTPYTMAKLYGRALPHVSDGWTILSEAGTFSESITVANSLTLQSTGTTTLDNLTMNGAGKTLTVEDNHNVTNVLTLTDGIVETTGATELHVLNTALAAVVGGSNLSHVRGNLRRGVTTGILYPYAVGNGTVEQRCQLQFTNLTGLTSVNVRFTNTAPGTSITSFTEANGNFTEVLQSGYWIVEPNLGGTSTNYEMRLRPQSFTDFPLGKAAYTIVKRVGLGNWLQDGTLTNPNPFASNNGVFGDGTLRRTALNGFSNFAVGASPLVPLPLSLVSFDAQLRQGKAVVIWQVVKEDPGTGYHVEKSLNGIDFQTIGRIEGEGKSVGHYEFVDPTWVPAEAQSAYYRLRIIEAGKTSLSQIEQLKINQKPQPVVWPNPTADYLFVRLDANAKVRMVNITGKVVFEGELNKGVQNIAVQQLPAGFYHLEVKTENGIERHNFQKN